MLKNLFKLNGFSPFLKQITTTQISIRPQFIRHLTTEENLQQNAVNKVRNPFNQERTSKPDPEMDTVDRETKLKILQLEVEIAYQEGRRVPDGRFLRDQHWEQLLTLPSKSARYKYLGYLWQIEKKKEGRQEKKLEKQLKVAERRDKERQMNEEHNHIIYGINHTTFFLRVYDSTINRLYNNRLVQAMQYGSKIVIDCSYDQHMNQREAVNAAKQLMLCFAENRMHDDPFDIHFCNADLKKTTMQSLQRHIPTMLDPEFPMNVHQKCFTEIFPKKNLVYLTPHCRTDLTSYNHDDIYIIGAMVDKMNNEPLSLAKAKRLGLRMARLPLDKYLQWGTGSGKSLTLNQMVSILLDLKSTGDWVKSLKHVPRRKVINPYNKQSNEKRILRSRADELKFNLDTWAKSDKKSPS
ncbi:mitochondrial ribonuclease P protein 1 homolog [Episyrphus balteatus]|uniref:mitochondrial ribonuclease P protein 1 homolog n=1 Tax=Episyrphus balteatus TaxID=286459 RepID=UPI002485E482|nr:mitochondrial ribonuclease P protein 1 homolog [Episyrphus balteatus]